MNKLTISIIALLCFLLVPISALAVNTGSALAPFSTTDMNGNAVDMKDIIGKKPVLLVFWASWCPNCKTEVPKINAMYEKYQDKGMAFLGINVGFNDSVDRATSFVEKTAMKYPNIFDKGNAITNSYQVRGVPTIVLADKSGQVVYRNFGTPEVDDTVFKNLMKE